MAGSLVICRSRYFQETLFNESPSVHRDYRELFRGQCPRITGFNRPDFLKRVFGSFRSFDINSVSFITERLILELRLNVLIFFGDLRLETFLRCS